MHSSGMVRAMLTRLCLLGFAVHSCSARPLAVKSSTSVFWTTAIQAQTNELMLGVVGIGQVAEQGPCTADTDGLIPLQFTVAVQPDTAGSAAAAPAPAKVDAVFLANSSKYSTIQPCLIVQQQQQEQDAKVPPKERLQAYMLGIQTYSYTAYFRPMPREICGTTPKVVIAATIQPGDQQQQQQEQGNTTEIDVVPCGCAYLIGDASAPAPAVPVACQAAGPKMQAASADSPPKFGESPTLMR